jgi:hypothetical protein
MTQQEQEMSLRLIAARNMKRIEILKQQHQQREEREEREARGGEDSATSTTATDTEILAIENTTS